jgi:hypothetical protein
MNGNVTGNLGLCVTSAAKLAPGNWYLRPQESDFGYPLDRGFSFLTTSGNGRAPFTAFSAGYRELAPSRCYSSWRGWRGRVPLA